MNREQYKGDSRYAKILEQMDLLNIMDVSTTKQSNNGTIVWKLPILSDRKGKYLEYASFSTGYVRNQGVDCHSNWQCNKRIESEPEYFELENGDYRKFTTRTCELIPIEIDRLEYMLKYVIKNEFIKRANTVQTGNFVPKWQYDNIRETVIEHGVDQHVPNVKVIIDGHKYKRQSPWDIAYELAKEDYTKEQIDEMLMCEIGEIIEIYTN